MFYGYSESEALRDPLLVNKYKPLKVDIEYVPSSQNHPHVHAYYLQFEDDVVAKEAEKFAKETLSEWYLLFWNDKIVYAIFKDKVFELPNEGDWKSEQYQEVQHYGGEHGIEIVYMDFNKNFKHFKEVLSK